MSTIQNTFNKHLKLLREHLNIKEVSFSDTPTGQDNPEPEITDTSLQGHFRDLEDKINAKGIDFKKFMSNLANLSDQDVNYLIQQYVPNEKMDQTKFEKIQYQIGPDMDDAWEYDADTIGYMMNACVVWNNAKEDFQRVISALNRSNERFYDGNYKPLNSLKTKTAIQTLEQHPRMQGFKAFITAAPYKFPFVGEEDAGG